MRWEDLKAPAEVPDPKQLARVRRLLVTPLAPVRPLPSSGFLILGFLMVFTTFSVAAAIPIGFLGFRALRTGQRATIYPLIAACAVVFSTAAAEQMIPGSKRKVRYPVSIAFAPLALAAFTLVIFRDFDTRDFVASGIPCLRLGTFCALIAGALMYSILRTGMTTTPLQTGATAGFFAGLAGFAVLALHCPILNAPHVLTWHLGAMALAGLSGLTIAIARR